MLMSILLSIILVVLLIGKINSEIKHSIYDIEEKIDKL